MSRIYSRVVLNKSLRCKKAAAAHLRLGAGAGDNVRHVEQDEKGAAASHLRLWAGVSDNV